MKNLRLYNTATKKVEEFIASKKTLGLYTCGPTVYHFAHIGNFRAFLFEDMLVRSLSYLGYKVKHVMNITDVGHLVGDSDVGEDKLAKTAREEKKTAWDIAAFYTHAFLNDSARLNINEPTLMPRATKHIKEQIALVGHLEKQGFTYTTSDGVYFDTTKFPQYGAFSGQRLEEKEGGKRIEVGEKKHPADFALWKFSYPQGRDRAKDDTLPVRDMEWQSPWGIGFPGWHVECSAMARKYLGQPFDIHVGGIDHIPVHHENEIAQSVCAYHAPLAKYWLHVAMLTLKDEKMSKSKGNIYTIQNLIDRGVDPISYRYFTCTAHYRTPLTFHFEALQAAQNALTNLRQLVRTWEKPGVRTPRLHEFEDRFSAALSNDIDLPQALSVLWDLAKSNASSKQKAATVLKFDQVFGFGLREYVGKKLKVPTDIQTLLRERAAAREQKNWSLSDDLRERMLVLGYVVEDSKNGQDVFEAPALIRS